MRTISIHARHNCTPCGCSVGSAYSFPSLPWLLLEYALASHVLRRSKCRDRGFHVQCSPKSRSENLRVGSNPSAFWSRFMSCEPNTLPLEPCLPYICDDFSVIACGGSPVSTKIWRRTSRNFNIDAVLLDWEKASKNVDPWPLISYLLGNVNLKNKELHQRTQGLQGL